MSSDGLKSLILKSNGETNANGHKHLCFNSSKYELKTSVVAHYCLKLSHEYQQISAGKLHMKCYVLCTMEVFKCHVFVDCMQS